MHKKLCAIALLAALAGCETTPIDRLSYGQERVVATKIAASCMPYKREGDAVFNNCINHEARREVATREHNRQAARAFFTALGEASQQYSEQQARRAEAFSRSNNSIHCHSYSMGNSVNTDCN